MRFSPRTHTVDVRCRDQTYGLSLHGGRTHQPGRRLVIKRTYTPEPGRTVTMWQGNPIFTKRLIASVFLDLGLF
jgi:hypothetical protein